MQQRQNKRNTKSPTFTCIIYNDGFDFHTVFIKSTSRLLWSMQKRNGCFRAIHTLSCRGNVQ